MMEQDQTLQSKAFPQPGLFSMDLLTVPFVVEGILEQWPSKQWTVDSLAQALGNRPFRCRLTPHDREKRTGPVWEAEGVYVECHLHHFSAWSRGEAAQDNPLAPFSPRHYSGYIDYKYMCDVFADHPHMLKEVQWSTLGLKEKDGKDSTVWIGSQGASTPCHYDTYGFNLVAQIQGRKRWVLFPPDQSCHLYPTRVPYEESSVFSQLELTCPDLHHFPSFRKATPIVITLEEGQVLYLPRHWWHYVTCVDTAISINTWVELPEDGESRAHEAVTRLLASSLIPYLSQTAGPHLEDFWINPTEELEEAACNVGYLKAALSSVAPAASAEAVEPSPDSDHLTETSCICRGESSTHLPVPENREGDTPSRRASSTHSPVPENEGHTASRLESSTQSPVPENEGHTASRLESSTQSPVPDNEGHTASRLESSTQSPVPEDEGHAASRLESSTQSPVLEDFEMSEESEECQTLRSGIFTPTGLLSRVGRTLQGSTVVTVESPFCLSQLLSSERLQGGSTCSLKHDGTVTERGNQNSHAPYAVTERESQNSSSPPCKRKNVDSESDGDWDVQEDAASKHTSSELFNADAEIVVHSDCSPKRKRPCIRENNKQPADAETSQYVESENTEVSSKPLCLHSETLGSQISVYCPQPCHLRHYIDLLQTRDEAGLKDCSTDKGGKEEREMSVDACDSCTAENQEENDEREVSVDPCQKPRNEQRPVEEAVLRSILHPEVVKLIVSKLKEQV